MLMFALLRFILTSLFYSGLCFLIFIFWAYATSLIMIQVIVAILSKPLTPFSGGKCSFASIAQLMVMFAFPKSGKLSYL